MIVLVSYVCTWSRSTYARYRIQGAKSPVTDKCRHVSAEVTPPAPRLLPCLRKRVWTRSNFDKEGSKRPRLKIKLKRPLAGGIACRFRNNKGVALMSTKRSAHKIINTTKKWDFGIAYRGQRFVFETTYRIILFIRSNPLALA